MKKAAAALFVVALLAMIIWPKAKDIGIYSAEGSIKGALGEGRLALSKLDSKPTDPRGAVPLRPLWNDYRWAGLPHPAGAGITLYPQRLPSDTGGYGYAAGELWIDCTHTDSRGSAWSSY